MHAFLRGSESPSLVEPLAGFGARDRLPALPGDVEGEEHEQAAGNNPTRWETPQRLASSACDSPAPKVVRVTLERTASAPFA